jgi:exodeoxyribonuclease V gamma subunit
MALQLHRAERTDLLADGLGALLAEPLADPFEQEVVVVPARGVERWLTQRLSHRLGARPGRDDGVCAGVRFLSPHSLVSVLLGRDRDDPWEPDRLVWPLLATIDASLGEPWCETLAAHLGHGVPGEEGVLRASRRYAVARRLAGLFASYAAQRPTLVTDWRQGRDTDGRGADLPDDLRWQAELWRRLLPAVDSPPPDLRHADTLARLARGGDGLELPARLSLFGHTRLPATEIELLAGLAAHRDVHLWLPQASPRLWDALAEVSAGGPVPREEDPSVERALHPLLASLGRDARELQRSLATAGGAGDEVAPPAPTPDTLLGRLQGDIRANRPLTADLRAGRRHDPDDRSVQVHACHGPSRQVEVLREVLVGLLEDDPTLEPRDIVVMCPDVETYAPLIQAGFGLGDAVPEGHPAHRLRVRLADRALSSTNPLLAVALRLVELAGGRVTASEVLDLLSADGVARRFRFDEDDLQRVERWVGEAGVRWGLDREQRAAFAMEKFGHNTWRAGLDRILLGVAVSGDDHSHLGPALPLDDVGSNDIDLAGRLAEFAARLQSCLSALHDAVTVGDWVAALETGVRALTEVGPDDVWQVTQLERELARTTNSASATAPESDGLGGSLLRLADVRTLLLSRLSGRPTRANFRTGTLTVCTMVPMRSVPHRVVCLLGLDDGVFPRTQWVDGDDVLARRPCTGERDVRGEDRQLLLDALMAAQERLVVCYTGANEHTGAPRPPAVPLGEILDALDRTTDAPVRDRVLVHHPLQAHDVRNLVPGELGTPAPFSFDRAALAGAVAASRPRTPLPPFLSGELSPRPPADLGLDDLRRFFAHPVASFCRQRLVVSTPLEAAEVLDAIPIDLNALQKWDVGDRLLRDLLAGVDADSVMTAELLRGTLPPGLLGHGTLKTVTEEVQALWSRTAELRAGEASAVDVAIELGGGRLLTGTVTGIRGHRALALSYSQPRAKQRLMSWIDLLALSVGHPDRAWIADTVGRRSGRPVRALAGPVDHRARDWLLDLIALYDHGQVTPLPAPVRTAMAWVGAGLSGDDPHQVAAREWVTDRSGNNPVPGEDADAWHTLVYGEAAPLSALVDVGLPDAADRIWGPLLACAPTVRPL